jgi:drug/metabolite transporter (DMT)-like permease
MSAMRKLPAYAAIYVFWGASFLAIREVVAVVPPFFAAALRFLSAGLILYAYSLWRGTPQPDRRLLRNTMLLGLVMFGIDYGCLFWAEKEIPSGLAAVIAATIPVWILLGEWWFGGSGRPTAKAIAGIVLGIAGVILLMIPSGLANSRFHVSALVLLLGCLFWAGGTVASRYVRLPRQLSMSSGLQMMWGGAYLLLFSAFGGEMGQLPGWAQWNWALVLAMGYLIVFASIIAFTAYVWLIAREPTARVASYAYVNPLIALLLGALLAGERLTPLEYAGAALVVAGVAFAIAAKRVTRQEPASKTA